MSLLCGLLVGVTCGVTAADKPKSNNEGKIVGTWEAKDDLFGGATFTTEFTKDGKFTMSVATADNKLVVTGKYTLGEGDKVNLTDLINSITGKTEHEATVTIKDDKLTMKVSDGKSKTFTRKAEKKGQVKSPTMAVHDHGPSLGLWRERGPVSITS
jgi:uncharacterized protein (TIGR03066 family)